MLGLRFCCLRLLRKFVLDVYLGLLLWVWLAFCRCYLIADELVVGLTILLCVAGLLTGALWL